eukprot:1156400-Pelagomonas_calceolata.AAC.1
MPQVVHKQCSKDAVDLPPCSLPFRWRIQTMEYEPGAVSTPFAGTGWSLAPNVIKERLESEQSQ